MRPTAPRLEVQRWTRAHEGIITGRDAKRMEIPSDTLQAMVDAQFLDRVERGIYRSRSWPERERQRAIGLCLAHPGLLVSHTSACREWAFRGITDRLVHFLCPHASSPTITGAVVHRCRKIDPVDIVPFDDGLMVTSPPRSVFDASYLVGFDATVSLIEHVLAHHCTFGTLDDTCRRLFHPRRPGSLVMRAALASRPPWREAMQSGAEVRVLEAIGEAGLPTPVTQCPVRLANGETIHPDFGWPEWQVALEVDDPDWHDFLLDRRRDKRRDLRAAAVGWLTCRLPTTDRGPALDASLVDLAAVLVQRGWEPSAPIRFALGLTA